MSGEKRRYTKKVRAELEEETRRRITESAVELHETVGPAYTSMSAVAERAGVRRSTLYRHFPDEATLFGACTGHWMAKNPPPDISRWAAIDDPDQRRRTALNEIYAYWRRPEPMMENLLRDEATNENVRRSFRAFHQFMAAAGEILLAGRGVRGHARKRTLAAIGHALDFSTWQSLARDQGLDDPDAIRLMLGLVEVAGSRDAAATS